MRSEKIGKMGNGKCYSIKEACQVFEKIIMQAVVSWISTITTHFQHGNVDYACEMLDVIRREHCFLECNASRICTTLVWGRGFEFVSDNAEDKDATGLYYLWEPFKCIYYL